MKLKILTYGLFCLFFAVSCNEPIIEPEALTQPQPQTTQLKSAVIGIKYYVAKTGKNSNTGTSATPFLTIQKGLNVAKAGDTVFVKAGTYQEYVTFQTSGTTGNPVVLKNYSKDVVTIDAQSTRIYCLYAVDKNNLVVDGIGVQNSTGYNVLFSGCENITVKNMASLLPINSTSKVTNILINASTTNWSKNIILQNTTSVGGQYGLRLGISLNGISILGGRYRYANIDGINYVAIITDSTKFSRNIIVNGTETAYNTRQGMVVYGGIKTATFRNFWSHHNGATGLQIENKSSNILIEDFICENNSLGGGYETGLWIDDSDGVTVRRGIMRYNQCGFRVSNSNNVLAYNLLIYSNNYTKIAGDVTNNSSGICFNSNPIGTTDNLYSTHIRLYNSVIYNNSNIYSQRGSVDLEGSGTYILNNNIIANDQSKRDIYRIGTHTLISDYNLLYNFRAINIYSNTKPGIYTASTSLNAYTTTYMQDTHSINANPLFVNAANRDFRLQSTSPAINAGVKVGLTTDYLNKPIIGLPDIGAYKN